MGRSTSGILGAVGVALLLASTAAADSWESSRKRTIDPINTEIHRHLPKSLKNRDLAGVLELYTTEVGSGLLWDGAATVYAGREESMSRWQPPAGPEPIRERYQHILDLFPRIDKAEVRIHRIWFEKPDAEGIPADARLLVRGFRADGSRGQLDQRVRMHLVKKDKDWRIASEEVTARELVTRAEPRFETATEKAGIRDTHTNEGSPTFHMIGGATSSSGSAVGDVDGDGCEDLFLPGNPDVKVYRNLCNGKFADVTEGSGIPHPYPAVATGAVFFDYDNDGKPDLFVAAVQGGNRLFHNVTTAKGPVRFAEVTKEAGVPDDPWSSMATIADYDRDGFLDIYVIRMGDLTHSTPTPNYQATNGLPNRLLHNERNGTFSDATKSAGVGDTGWGLAGAWGDYDGDGLPDLYVANEYGFSVLYRNDGGGKFSDVSEKTGAEIRTAGMGMAWGDYDGDGNLDAFVSAMYANSRWALFHPDFPAPIPWYFKALAFLMPGQVEARSQGIIDDLTRGSTLLRNNGDGSFTDVSDKAGVRDAQWGWGAEFLDYDNDGRLDIFAENGFVTGPIPDDV